MTTIPALNFKAEFAEKVKSGEKRQTIRKFRKDGRDPKAGQTLYLYTGQRTKACQKIGEVVCRETEVILIDYGKVVLACFPLSVYEKLKFAEADGFHTYKEFQDFFKSHYGLPFQGLLIKW